MDDRLELDVTLLGELYEEIDRNPPAIETRKILIEQYLFANWKDSATGAIEELYAICANDPQVSQWYIMYCSARPNHLQQSVHKSAAQSSSSLSTLRSRFAHAARGTLRRVPRKPEWVFEESEQLAGLSRIQEQYTNLRSSAASLLHDMKLFQNLQMGKGKQRQGNSANSTITALEHLAAGRITTALEELALPKSPVNTVPREAIHSTGRSVIPKTPHELAKQIKKNPPNGYCIAMKDLETMTNLLLQKPELDQEAVREQMVKRVQAIVASLPDDLQIHPQTAMMHLEHEEFDKNYVNTETMYGDDVADIPRERFLATEDGYAWDMVFVDTDFFVNLSANVLQ
jgi:hypothetical protein